MKYDALADPLPRVGSADEISRDLGPPLAQRLRRPPWVAPSQSSKMRPTFGMDFKPEKEGFCVCAQAG